MRSPAAGFRGQRPGLAAEQLPAEYARLATMARIKSGRLATYKERLATGVIPKSVDGIIRAMYWLDIAGTLGGPKLLHWEAGELTYPRVDVVPSPVLEATGEPFYFTGVGAPKVSNYALAITEPPVDISLGYPHRWYTLGVPAPEDPPTLEVTAAITDPTSLPLLNPGAEDGTLQWTTDSGTLTSIDETDVPGLDPYAGDKYFSFASSATSEIYQEVPSTLITGQLVTLAWQQASGANLSKAGLKMEFLDNMGAPLGSVTSTIQAGAVLTWGARSINGSIPAGTTDIKVTMDAEKVGAGTCDVYIDAITLTYDEASVFSDGSSLDDFIVSPNAGGSRPRVVEVDGTVGLPVSSISMRSDSATAWFYRDYGGIDSSRIDYQISLRKREGIWNSVVLLAGGSGAGHAVLFDVGNERIALMQRTTWDGTNNGVLVQEIASGLSYAGTEWLTVLASMTLISESQASVKLTVTNAATSEVLVNAATFTIPINGGNLGVTSLSTSDSGKSYVDNISFIATPPSPIPVDQIGSTAYKFTWVGGLNGGDESAPSPVSDTVRRNDGATVIVTTSIDRPADRNVTLKRIYRLNSINGQTAIYQLVAEIPWDQAEYEDTLDNSELGREIVAQDDWLPPPTNGHSLVVAANGMGSLLSGKDVCFSPIGKLHAWPLDWRRPMKFTGVAQAVYDADIIIATQGAPYIAQGSDPSDMTLLPTDDNQGCVSARSMVTIKGYGAIYASPDGLVAVSRSGVTLITKEVITRKEWQALTPSSITGVVHDDLYFGFYDNGTPGGFIFDPATGDWFDLGFHATAATYNPLTDVLSLAVGGNRHEWDNGAAAAAYDYWSGEFILPRRVSWAWCRIRLMSGSVQFRLYYDGTLVHTETITSQREFRIPKATAENSYSWRLDGTGEVAISPILAERSEELK